VKHVYTLLKSQNLWKIPFEQKGFDPCVPAVSINQIQVDPFSHGSRNPYPYLYIFPRNLNRLLGQGIVLSGLFFLKYNCELVRYFKNC